MRTESLAFLNRLTTAVVLVACGQDWTGGWANSPNFALASSPDPAYGVQDEELCFCRIRLNLCRVEDDEDCSDPVQLFGSTFDFSCDAADWLVELPPLTLSGQLGDRWLVLDSTRIGVRLLADEPECSGEFFLDSPHEEEQTVDVTNLRPAPHGRSGRYVLESGPQEGQFLQASLECLCLPL